MTNPIVDSEPHSRISVEALRRFLTIKGEGDEWDFKERLDIGSKRGRSDLAKDAMALANHAGGGTLIFGVTKNYDAAGIDDSQPFDTTTIHNAISQYIDGDFICPAAAHAIQLPGEAGSKSFGLIYFSRSGDMHPILAARESAAGDDRPLVFRPGDILIRRGAQSIRANSGDVRRLLARPSLHVKQIEAALELWASAAELRAKMSGLEFVYTILLESEYTDAFKNARIKAHLSDTNFVNFATDVADLQKRVSLNRPFVSDELYKLYRSYTSFVGRAMMKVLRAIEEDGDLRPWDALQDGTEDIAILSILQQILSDSIINQARSGYSPMKPIAPVIDAIDELLCDQVRKYISNGAPPQPDKAVCADTHGR